MASQPELWNLPTNYDMLAAHVELDGKKAVDVGAGAGGLVRFMRSQGADPIGVEYGESMIAQAREADPDNLDSYLEGVGQDLPVNNDAVDLVVFCYSLHHVPGESLPDALSEASRVLRSGGTLAILEPIAEGSGFETHKLIDDETAVRAAAQSALDNDLPSSFTQVKQLRYSTGYSYSGMDELEKVVVDIDPRRRDAFDAVRDQVSETFLEQSELAGGRYWFQQPVLMRIFTKAAMIRRDNGKLSR